MIIPVNDKMTLVLCAIVAAVNLWGQERTITERIIDRISSELIGKHPVNGVY